MDKTSVKKILAIISANYPNFKVDNAKQTVEAWHWTLGEYREEEILVALKSFIITEDKGFAPTPGQLIGKLNFLKETSQGDEISDLAAWGMVYKAICNSNYNSKSEFEKLPEVVQKAIGNSSQLQEWASMDNDTVKSVIQSNFLRSYRVVANRKKELDKLPESMKQLLGQATERIGIE